MNNYFPKLAMARFSKEISERNNGQKLTSMHSTNPEPFSQNELEETIGCSFNQILKDVNLGFAADEGSMALRQSIASNLYIKRSAAEVVAHAGAQEALFCAFYALLKAGDKVLAVAPIFEPLMQIPINMGCEVSYVYLDEKNHWSLDLNEIESQFKMGCRLFIINFPHNPTGAMLSFNELNQIVQLCYKYNVWLLSDEVFRGLEHQQDIQLPAVADIYDKGISIGVISKAFAVPGIRIGWLVCKNQEFREKAVDIKGYLSICNSQIDEKLVSVILNKSNNLLKRNLDIILKNKKLLQDFKSLNGHKLEIIIPNAGCCIYALVDNCDEVVDELAKELNYLLYPSSLFKTDVSGLRIGFGSSKFADFVKLVS